MTLKPDIPRRIARPHFRRASTTLSSRIVSDVREALLDGSLKPGDLLGTEGSLSEEFDVSRVAARDALKCLEAMGVVRIRAGAGGGARIAEGNAALLADVVAIQLRLIGAQPGEIMDAQRAIEITTAELAAQRRDDTDLEILEALLTDSGKQLDDPGAFTQSGFAFHVAIADAARNKVLKMQLLAMHFIAWPKHNPTLTSDFAQHVLDVHQELFNRIEARDASGARKCMSDHINQIHVRRVPDSDGVKVVSGCC